MEIQWSLLAFSLIAGAGGSLLAFVGVSQICGYAAKSRRNLVAAAVVLVVLGGVCSVFHLEQKANIMAAAANIFSFSPISMELIMVGATVVLGIAYLAAIVKEAGALACKIAAVLASASGIVLGFVTGAGYMMGAQPLWNTPLLPLAYLGTDLALGGALYLLGIAAMKDDGDARSIPALSAFVVSLASLLLSFAYGASTGFDQQALFWVGVMGLGALCNVVCSFLLARKARRESSLALPLCAANAAFALCASVCLRSFMWLLGTGTLSLFAVAAEHGIL